jgi:PHP N-terminal domain protein
LKEYKSNSDFYTEEKEEAINKILTLLQELRIATAKERDEVIQKNKVINVVIGVFSEINNEIKSDRTSQENENKDMVNEIRDFAVNIKKYLINQNKEIEFPVFPSAIEGISVKSKYGFKFIKEAKYSNANLERALYKELFVQNYQSKEKIMNVNSREEFINAVKGSTSYEMIDNSLNSNVQKFITEYTREETRIKDENGTDEIGTTPGEIALTYYKLQLSNEINSNVILIDQPEDDISMKRIENYLINYFNSVRDKKQIIFVTHNPLLVVNLDVDNVINVTKDRTNIIELKSGCLEHDNLLEIVSESLDGGKEAVERRLKVYGTN